MRELQLDLVARVDAGLAGDAQRLQQLLGAPHSLRSSPYL
jgi:hypothetical protein